MLMNVRENLVNKFVTISQDPLLVHVKEASKKLTLIQNPNSVFQSIVRIFE